MARELSLLALACLVCDLLEKSAENTAVKHLATSLVCGACVCLGVKITYNSVSKFVEIVSKPVKEGAKIGKEAALDKLKNGGK